MIARERLEEVGRLLDTPVDPAVPREVDEVARFRSAARRIMEDDALAADRDRLIAALLLQTDLAALPSWCEAAVFAEVAPAPPTFVPMTEQVERDGRRLLSLGFSCCPTCSRRLIDPITLDRSARSRRWADEDGARRGRAARDVGD